MARRSSEMAEFVDKIRKKLTSARDLENRAIQKVDAAQRELDMIRAERMALQDLLPPDVPKPPRVRGKSQAKDGLPSGVETP